MATIRVQAEDFDPGAEQDALLAGHPEIGAIASFLGVVRGPAAALHLEHYPGMTEAALAAMAATAETRFGLTGCTIIHRFGRLPPGARIVLVLTAAPHRRAALDATAFLIDWLKTDAPFWKKEELADGTTRWIEARVEDDAARAAWERG